MRIVDEFEIPARYGRAFVKRGQVFRIFPIEDGQVGDYHFGNMGGRCSPKLYELRDAITARGHRSCQGNLTEALAPFGLTGDDVRGE